MFFCFAKPRDLLGQNKSALDKQCITALPLNEMQHVIVHVFRQVITKKNEELFRETIKVGTSF